MAKDFQEAREWAKKWGWVVLREEIDRLVCLNGTMHIAIIPILNSKTTDEEIPDIIGNMPWDPGA